MMSSLKTNKKLRKAFSLGEVLISAFILTVGLTATTALIAASISNAYDNREAVIAAELAQEGVELIRNVRDQNFALEAEGIPAGQGFAGFSESDKHCRMNSDDTIFTCTTSQGTPGSSSNKYYLSTPDYPGIGQRFAHTASQSRFGRYIYIDYSTANLNAEVISYVFWDWGNPGSMPPSIRSNGKDTSRCTLSNKCIFSEAFFTKWSQ
jgi:Tfp pilus assembly protein PilV